jgi:hypothetical protein
MRTRIWVIYCDTCVATGKKYVGQTKRTATWRWRKHVHEAQHNRGSPALSAAIRKYGRKHWFHGILETVGSQDEANVAETKWIAQLGTLSPNGYNIDLGGAQPKTPEVVEKMRAAYMRKSDDAKKRQIERLRRSYEEWLATTTHEQRQQVGRDAWNGYTPEERSAITRAGKAKQSTESRRAAGLKGKVNMTPEARRAPRAQQIANTTPEQRSASARKGAANLTPEQLERRRECGREMMAKLQSARTLESETKRGEAIRAAHAAKTTEEKQTASAKRWTTRRANGEDASETGRKAWETRRRNARLRAFKALVAEIAARPPELSYGC